MSDFEAQEADAVLGGGDLEATARIEDGNDDRLKVLLNGSGFADVSEDLREISRGIHPAILSKGGLGPAVETLARRSAVPVQLDLRVDGRLPESAEAAAYYVVAEALTNATKHAHASQVNVHIEATYANLHVSIRDDGIGGADSIKGSGLTGLTDRVEALGGQMEISSHAGNGTSILVEIPLQVE